MQQGRTGDVHAMCLSAVCNALQFHEHIHEQWGLASSGSSISAQYSKGKCATCTHLTGGTCYMSMHNQAVSSLMANSLLHTARARCQKNKLYTVATIVCKAADGHVQRMHSKARQSQHSQKQKMWYEPSVRPCAPRYKWFYPHDPSTHLTPPFT